MERRRLRATSPGAALLWLLLLLGGLGAQAAAHDWWLEPLAAPAPGATVELAAFVGPAFRGERVARDPERVRRFVAIDAQGERPLAGACGAEPIGRVELRAAGTTVVAFESVPAHVFLRAPEFERYLGEEGLERIVALRASRGESRKMGLEQFTRCAKTLLRAGAAPRAEGGAPAPFDRVAGLPLELVAAVDPATLAGGGRFAATLRFGDAPLEGALVAAVERGAPDRRVTARSDAKGQVELALDHAGFWLVKAVHMVEAEKASRLDWSSYWASLSFEIPERPR